MCLCEQEFDRRVDEQARSICEIAVSKRPKVVKSDVQASYPHRCPKQLSSKNIEQVVAASETIVVYRRAS